MTAAPLLSRLVKRVDRVLATVALGRLAAPDPRDKNHPLRSATEPPPRLVSTFWPFVAPHIFQGNHPRCVGYGWTNWLTSAPMVHRALGLGMTPNQYAISVYDRAQRVDEWPGEDYEGTSVRAGAKVIFADGRIEGGYKWGATAAQARDHIIGYGPGVAGFNWYERMFVPDADGFLLPEGEIAGGHAFLVLGFSVERNAFRILNQWQERDKKGNIGEWGEKNRAWIRFDHFDQLMHEDGEFCAGIEVKPATEV